MEEKPNIIVRSGPKAKWYFKKVPSEDVESRISQYMEKNEPGIDMKSYMNCPHCAEESEVRLPIEASFFWPDR